MKNILVTGNMGYVGSCLVQYLRNRYPTARIDGLDTGFYAACLTTPSVVPERFLNRQYYVDVRDIGEEMLRGFDAVIHLAAISNDPMGKIYEDLTQDINEQATLNLAVMSRKAGVSSFIFASSCSVYGLAQEGPRNEQSTVNPLTAYARSKVNSERALRELVGESFQVTCLRFATACGFSPRLRLDLVLNDFVASALATGVIQILSDGSPWRPLIDVHDMARAFDWALSRHVGGPYLVVNVGADRGNYQVRDLAWAVAEEIARTEIRINKDAAPDMRSYKVDFDLFRSLAPDHQPSCPLNSSIKQLKEGLTGMGFRDTNFRGSYLMRLNMLSQLRDTGQLTKDLRWRGLDQEASA